MIGEKENVTIFENDIDPNFYTNITFPDSYLSVDIETSGLDWKKDKIATIQVCNSRKIAIIKILDERVTPKYLIQLFHDPSILKIFHHAMFDIRFMTERWNTIFQNIACTKVASKLINNEKEDHSLKKLLRKYLSVGLQKDLWGSNWFKESLSNDQIRYAKDDVLYLHRLFKTLKKQVEANNKEHVMNACFKFLPYNAWLQVNNYKGIFEY